MKTTTQENFAAAIADTITKTKAAPDTMTVINEDWEDVEISTISLKQEILTALSAKNLQFTPAIPVKQNVRFSVHLSENAAELLYRILEL